MFEREPKWGELLLPEPEERVRELQDDEAAALDEAMRDDYGPFFAFVRASGLRQAECVTLRWSEVNFGTKQIVRIGQGRPARRVPDHRHDPRDPVPAAGAAPGVRVHLCRGLRQQAARRRARPALPADHQRRQVGMAADAGQGGRHGFPLPRLPPRLRHQAAARHRQSEAGAEGAQPRRHQIHAAICARSGRGHRRRRRARGEVPEKIPERGFRKVG